VKDFPFKRPILFTYRVAPISALFSTFFFGGSFTGMMVAKIDVIRENLAFYHSPYKDRNHPRLFAQYLETPSEREDGNYYPAFLFRKEDRTVFGVKEFWEWPRADLRDLATHVVLDAEFRKTLISDDPMLPKMWKKR